MKKTKALILSLLLLTGIGAQAKDYNASLFGIKSNGTTLNTTAIQKWTFGILRRTLPDRIYRAEKQRNDPVERRSCTVGIYQPL